MTSRIVSRAEWLEARKAHLAKEKAFTRPREELSRDHRALLNGAYHLLDLTSKGRDEQGLSFSMSWVRRHDQY